MANIVPEMTKYSPNVSEDVRPGDYYVSVVDAARYALVAGPFSTHRGALDMVARAREVGEDVDAKSVFYGWGTCRVETTHIVPRLGILNDRLGI